MTTVTLAPPQFLQYLNPNNSGSPAVGYKLFTYEAGTSTKQATYTDSSAGTPNANPLTLDGNGVASIWGDPTLPFKFVWAPANSPDPPTSPIRTLDNFYFPLTFPSINPRTAAEISAGVTPTNYAYPPLDVRRYGADPTGTNDSTLAINTAISVTQFVGFGGLVYLPTGKYLVGSTGVYVTATTQNGFVIAGDRGPYATTIINGSTNQPALSFGDGVSLRSHIGVRDIYFSQSSSVTAVAGNCAILFNKIQTGFIDNVIVSSSAGSPYTAVILTGCVNNILRAVRVAGCLLDGFQFTATTDLFATDCYSEVQGNNGYTLNGTQGCYFKSCITFQCAGSGWWLVSTNPASLPNFNNTFENCGGDTSGAANWAITDSSNTTWLECWGATQISHSVNVTADGFFISTANCHHLTFIATEASFNNGNGFNVYDPGSSAPTYLQFIGCRCGIQAWTGNNGNGQGGSGGYGLSINAGVSHVRIDGGIFQDNASGPMNLAISGSFIAQDVVVSGNPMGFVAANQSGAGSIGSGNSSVVVTHGLSFTPIISDITVTPGGSSGNLKAAGGAVFWVSAVGSTTFTVSVDASLTGTWTFSWKARFPGS